MSTLPIITEIKNKIDVAVNTVAEIEQVYAFPFLSTIFETMSYPSVLIFMEPTDWADRNQKEHNIVNANLEVWYEVSEDAETLSNEGERLEALIHQAIFTSCRNKVDGLARNIQRITKIPPDYKFPQDGFGVVNMQYTIHYLTTWGNGFSQV